MKHILSFDAETDGLHGAVIAIGAVYATCNDDYTNVVEVSKFNGSLVDFSAVQNNWVRENVLPKLQKDTTAQRFETMESLVIAFAGFYKELRSRFEKKLEAVTFCAFPVETNLLRKMHEIGEIGEFEHPCPLLDISTLLHVCCQSQVLGDIITDAASIEKNYNALMRAGGKTYQPTQAHTPLYDARCQLDVYAALMIITTVGLDALELFRNTVRASNKLPLKPLL